MLVPSAQARGEKVAKQQNGSPEKWLPLYRAIRCIAFALQFLPFVDSYFRFFIAINLNGL